MIEQKERELLAKIDELNSKLNSVKNEQFELLKNFDLAIVDTRDDMRIVNSIGAIEEIFKDVSKRFKHGENLIKIVYKITKNTSEMDEAVQGQDEDKKILEDSIADFLATKKNEKIMRIVGEKEDGEVFLLEWLIIRGERYLRSYFKIIPTNAIVKEVQAKLEAELENSKKNMKQVLDFIGDGVTILDIKSRIVYLNDKARKSFISKEKTLLQSAKFEGRIFRELFATDDPDDQRRREYFNKEAIITKQMQSYTKRINETDVRYEVYPLISDTQSVTGLAVISKFSAEQKEAPQQMDNSKLIATLKALAEDNKVMKERIKELENNQQWFMKTNKEYQDTIKLLYTFMEKLPIPVSILQLPELKFDFVNKAFEKKFKLKRDDVKKKEDKEVFSPEINSILSKLNNDALECKDIVEVSNNIISARQIALCNTYNNPTHLIRVYCTVKL